MKLISYTHAGERRFGAAHGKLAVDLHRAAVLMLRERGEPRPQAAARSRVPGEAVAFLEGGPATLDAAAQALAWVDEALRGGREAELRAETIVADLGAVRLRAPVPRPAKIICLGLNYRDHAIETNMPIPETPVLFSKYASSVIGPDEAIQIPRASQSVDYEAEFAFVIGRGGRHIPAGRAMEHVAGYTIANDVSVRDYQMRTGQWMIGKTFDTHCPMGPWLVTRDEVPDPHALDISLTVNGEKLQSSNTKQLIFRIPDIIAYLSAAFTLEPGDVILTGTPSGVGMARKPQRWLVPGDRVRIEVQGVGVLENPVVAEK